MLLPRHLAEIIECEQMRRGGEMGEAQGIAREPAPRLGEMARYSRDDNADCHVRRASPPYWERCFAARSGGTPSRLRDRRSPRRKTYDGTNRPGGVPPALAAASPGERLKATGVALVDGVGEIFGDGVGARDRHMRVCDRRRQGAGRVQLDETAPPLPRLLLGQLGLDPAFGERQADRAGDGSREGNAGVSAIAPFGGCSCKIGRAGFRGSV